MDNLTIQPQSQPVSHLAETQAKFKGMHPDRIILMRSKDWYVTANEDAVTVRNAWYHSDQDKAGRETGRIPSYRS